MKRENFYTMKQPELGKKISKIRKEKGLTQEELVNKCNINVRTIQRIEAGEVNPRSFTIKTIISVLGVDKDLFFKETEKNTNELTKKEKGTLTTSWIMGIFFLFLNITGIIVDIHFLSDDSNMMKNLYFRIPFGIIIIIALVIFTKGYYLLGKKYNNLLLVNAVYIYGILYFLIGLLSIGIIAFNLNEIIVTVFMFVLFGLAEIIIGLGILKLKETLGDFPKTFAILKISNGILFLTILLAPIAWFIGFVIIIMEIIFFYNTSKRKLI